MKRMITASLVMAVLMVCWTVGAMATAPGATVNPNGFPSGPHYNLNIHGKKTGFSCPEQQYDEFGNPIYGNSVFVPEDGKGIQILMQSGTGKRAEAFTELRATDPCSGFDGDAAVVQLPKNDAGYKVYARALAKPTNDPSMTITPNLVSVQDEYGNDLVYLGLVTNGGFVRADGMTLTRGKGKSTAVDVTGLFQWSGEVCYFSPPDGAYQFSQICCIDFDADGIFDSCEQPSVDLLGTSYCATAGYSLLSTFCKSYVNEWVFSIGDFVEYLWDLENNGSKLIQVRFYPN